MTTAASQPYEIKERNYFAAARGEVLPLLPSGIRRVLELGCGAGGTLELISRNYPGIETFGMEIVASVADQARTRVDHIFVGNIEAVMPPIEPGSLDAILCLDVLEHLLDPWAVLARLKTLLAPGGVLIASIPNVQNFRVVLPLLRGRWEYTAEGLLDRTHLRFFTRASAIALMESSGMKVDRVDVTGIYGRTLRAMNLFPWLRPFLGFQFLIRAQNARAAAAQ